MNEQKRRGRPMKSENEKRSKKFNMTMKPELFSKLNKLAAERQLSTGQRFSVNEVINNVLEKYFEQGEIENDNL